MAEQEYDACCRDCEMSNEQNSLDFCFELQILL